MSDLQDYLDVDKLSAYEEINHLVRDLHTYNLKLVMPIRDQVILDVPCGTGYYVREFFKEGAAKVIASDIVAVEIEVSKKKAMESGVPDDFVEYFVHDARIPKQLSTTLVDVCSCIHLFCFAENLDQLHGMARMINVNLKPGGLCAVILCSIGNDDEKYRKALESHKEMLVYLDPQPTERLQPRKVHTVAEGFNLIRYVWRHDVVSEVLKEEGFSRTEIVPYQFEPSSEYVQWYIDATARKMIVARKTN